MTITDALNSAYMRLLRDLQDDCFANASERDVMMIMLRDGRKAQVTMKIETDPEEWL